MRNGSVCEEWELEWDTIEDVGVEEALCGVLGDWLEED
jgi:hypothetical protein